MAVTVAVTGTGAVAGSVAVTGAVAGALVGWGPLAVSGVTGVSLALAGAVSMGVTGTLRVAVRHVCAGGGTRRFGRRLHGAHGQIIPRVTEAYCSPRPAGR